MGRSRAGGRVIFAGRQPEIAPGRSFLEAPATEIAFPTAGLRDLPKPDLVMAPPVPAVKYLHRRLADAEVYFLFNESQAELTNRLVRSTRRRLRPGRSQRVMSNS